MLKRGVFVATIVYTIFIIVASLIKLDNFPKVEISFGDKIFHFLTYAVLTVSWFFSFSFTFKVKIKKALLSAVLLSVIFGIILEVLQDSLTVYRALDIYDVFANTLGALAALVILMKAKSLHVKN
ncbi:VanZ family protein [Seonamhaeicola aphaedonensis]|uniref:VanZ like protein n=1 Tax=Seonamhaeicola aphaedonensis TaxID=1461338 RepID=A0A3D9HGQ9_9FLAO|nr:VanZ family protein [Seonamhaeicola aphaedonensis]RED48692.1 VanZ like protein [Seonamhaeicola aphaedonensis]